MRGCAWMLACVLSAASLACNGAWRGGDEPRPATPLTDQSHGGEYDAPMAAPVERAAPVVDRSFGRREAVLLAPLDESSQYLSSVYVPPAQPADTGAEPADGAAIGGRLGHMEPTDDGRWRFVFQPADGEAEPLEALTILPNAYLERMVDIIASGSGGAVTFEVAGEATRYRGDGYLMIHKAAVVEHQTAAGADGGESGRTP